MSLPLDWLIESPSLLSDENRRSKSKHLDHNSSELESDVSDPTNSELWPMAKRSFNNNYYDYSLSDLKYIDMRSCINEYVCYIICGYHFMYPKNHAEKVKFDGPQNRRPYMRRIFCIELRPALISSGRGRSLRTLRRLLLVYIFFYKVNETILPNKLYAEQEVCCGPVNGYRPMLPGPGTHPAWPRHYINI